MPSTHAAIAAPTPCSSCAASAPRYGRIEVLHGVDLVVPRGQVVALLGPNGARQDHDAQVVARPDRADDARRRLHRRGRARQRRRARRRSPARGVCTIPEGRGIFPNLTVRENLRMATYTGASLGRRRGRRLRAVPAARRAAQAARRHAVGRRAADARHGPGARHRPGAAAARRAVDGPRAAHRRGALRDRRARSRREGVSILVVEQFARTVLGVADLAAIMLHGRVTAAGAPAEIEAQLSSEYMGA